MTDPQGLANEVGAAVRRAERAAGNANLGQTLVELGTLHNLLGQAYVAVNRILDRAGMPPLEWPPIATDLPGDGAETRSGGGPKEEPSQGPSADQPPA